MFKDSRFPYGKRLEIGGEGQLWGISGIVSTTDNSGKEITELVCIEAGPNTSHKGKKTLFMPPNDLLRAINTKKFEKDYPSRNPYS